MTDQKFPHIGVGVLIIKGDHILMQKRLNAHGEGTWSPGGGHLEFGETIEECARREIKEETGLVINDIQILGFTNDVFKEEDKHYVTIFCAAEWEKGEPVICEPDKIEKLEWFHWSELPEPLFLPVRLAKQHIIKLFES